jgi:hypothetical protein
VTISEIQLGQTLLADRAYDSEALLQSLADRGASANVKPMPHRVNIPPFSLYSIALATGLRRNARQQFLGKAQKSSARLYLLQVPVCPPLLRFV